MPQTLHPRKILQHGCNPELVLSARSHGLFRKSPFLGPRRQKKMWSPNDSCELYRSNSFLSASNCLKISPNRTREMISVREGDSRVGKITYFMADNENEVSWCRIYHLVEFIIAIIFLKASCQLIE